MTTTTTWLSIWRHSNSCVPGCRAILSLSLGWSITLQHTRLPMVSQISQHNPRQRLGQNPLKISDESIKSTPTPHTQTTTAPMHNLFYTHLQPTDWIMHTKILLQLNMSNPQRFKRPNPAKVHSVEYILHMQCLQVSCPNQVVHTQSLLMEKLY